MANFLPGTTRRRLTTMAAAVATVVLTASLAPSTGAVAAGPGASPQAANATAPARTVDVMTRNLYLGASLDRIIGALTTGDTDIITDAATLTWLEVKASDPEERMAAIADEIVATRPAVVGLQEVTKWSTLDVGPAGGLTGPNVAYDFLDLLLDALDDRGMTYHEVPGATADNFSSPLIPVDDGLTRAVQLADRDVILRRADVRAWNGNNGNFGSFLNLPDGTEVARGWGSADVRTKLATFRFVNSHLEALGPETLRMAQIVELFAEQMKLSNQYGELPTVYVGDYNTAAPKYLSAGDTTSGGEAAYELLLTQLDDTWVSANSQANGFTCCQAALLDNMNSVLDERTDFVMTTPGITTERAALVGATPVDLPGDTWWASDHAGVVAGLVIDRVVPAGPGGRTALRHRG